MSILIAESLEKKYRSRKVVNNLSFNIKSGEIIGLLGPNGAGKPLPSIWLLAWSHAPREKLY